MLVCWSCASLGLLLSQLASASEVHGRGLGHVVDRDHAGDQSLAYVPIGEEGDNYYAGGFNGGSTKKFLEMAEVISDRVNRDMANGVIALWHDESHLNRYLIDNPPSITLTPSYCFAEEQMNNPQYPYEPKIIALKKNHNELRS